MELECLLIIRFCTLPVFQCQSHEIRIEISRLYKKSVELRTCCPFHTLRLLALPILVERATRNPRRWVYITIPISTNVIHLIKTIRVWYADTRMHIKNIPWASTVAMFWLRWNFARIPECQEQSACKRFLLYRDYFPPNLRFACLGLFSRPCHTLHGVSCLVCHYERTRLTFTTTNRAVIVRCKYI